MYSAADKNRPGKQRLLRPQDHIGPRLAHHIDPLACGDLQPATLAEGVGLHALVGPKVTAIQRPEMPGLRLQAMSAQIGHVIAVGHEADILAVVLGGDVEPGLRSQCPHFLLCHAPQREARPRQLGLGEAIEHIGLVLGAILGAQKQIPATPRVKAHLGIMASGDAVIAQLQLRIQKSA